MARQKENLFVSTVKVIYYIHDKVAAIQEASGCKAKNKNNNYGRTCRDVAYGCRTYLSLVHCHLLGLDKMNKEPESNYGNNRPIEQSLICWWRSIEKFGNPRPKISLDTKPPICNSHERAINFLLKFQHYLCQLATSLPVEKMWQTIDQFV